MSHTYDSKAATKQQQDNNEATAELDDSKELGKASLHNHNAVPFIALSRGVICGVYITISNDPRLITTYPLPLPPTSPTCM